MLRDILEVSNFTTADSRGTGLVFVYKYSNKKNDVINAFSGTHRPRDELNI